MRIKKQNKVAHYNFEDSKQQVRAIIFGNLMLAICFIFSVNNPFLYNPRVIHCISCVAAFTLLVKFYNWQSREVNLLLIIGYLAFIAAEIIILGIPAQPITPQSSYYMSKGVMLEMFIALLPLLYFGLKLAFVLPLVSVFITSKEIYPSSNESKRFEQT